MIFRTRNQFNSYVVVLVLCALMVVRCGGRVEIEKLPHIPTAVEGMGKGVAAPFCGTLGAGVIVAGGANFPNIPAAKGGKKVFYDGVYYLLNGKWTTLGKLPYAVASGATASTGDALYFVAGMSPTGALSSVLKLTLSGDEGAPKMKLEKVVELPFTVEQCGATIVSGLLYIVGGNRDGVPSGEVTTVNLGSGEVRHLTQMPQVMLQPVVVSVESEIYVWGGYTLPTVESRAKAIDYGYCLDVSTSEIEKIEGVQGGTLTGSSAVLSEGKVYVVGGVNKEIFENAVNRRYDLSRGVGDTVMLKKQETEYMNYTPADFRFIRDIRVFDPKEKKWQVLQSATNFALAGAGVATVGGNLYIVNGEVMPGVRTPEVLKLKIN